MHWWARNEGLIVRLTGHSNKVTVGLCSFTLHNKGEWIYSCILLERGIVKDHGHVADCTALSDSDVVSLQDPIFEEVGLNASTQIYCGKVPDVNQIKLSKESAVNKGPFANLATHQA